MILRFATVAAVALSLLATVGSAQTTAEVLQKGIYTQQTAGDVDGAIQTYRQVISMAGADRATAGRAQMQLVSAFLQKGDFPGAAREFNTLVMNYGDQKEVVASMRTAMQMAARMGLAQPAAQGSPTLTKGTLVNGVYHNNTTGTEIKVPEGFSVTGDGPSSGEGDAVLLRDNSGQSYFVWMISNPGATADIPAALDHDVDYKVHQRTVDGVQSFKARPGTMMKWGAGNAQMESVAFDFGTTNGAQVEYDTWARTEKTHVYFRAICPAASIAGMQDRLQILVGATTLP
jgi:hypothetical protein